VVVQDATGVIVEVNQAAEEILGLTADQMMGITSTDPTWRTVHEDGSPWPGDSHPISVVVQTGQPVRRAIMGVYKPDDSLTWILINAVPVGELGSPDFRAVVSFTDITEQREIEAALSESNAELRRFAYVASHDMQAPLRRIISYSDLLREEVEAGSEAANLAGLLARNARSMRDVVHAVLEYSRISAPQRTTNVNVRRLLLAAQERAAAELERAGAFVEIDAEPDMVADVDAAQSLVALTHLLVNAAQNADPDRPCKIRLSAEIAAGDRLVIRVIDNSVGIDPAAQDRVFEMFERLRESRGQGMGLPIARRIAQRHAGSLTVSSDGRTGSEFTFTLARTGD